jgi:hypothetical protein
MKIPTENTCTKLTSKQNSFKCFTGSLACAALLLFASPSSGQVVTDNFDAGTLNSAWQVRNVVQPLGGFVSNTFPTNGTGRALRLQRGSANMTPLGQPQAYGTGRAWLFRTNDYTSFYVAMDIVNWNDGTNQAIVLLARASGFDETLGAGFPPGLGTTDGYVCNYDNVQDGTGPGDRLGGEFQINMVVGENPITLAAAEVQLTVGKSYRQIFTGTNTTLVGQLYDLEDLTKPIVTIVVEDNTYASGKSGIVTFHRDSGTHPNLTDMTVDNYYAGPNDPNADIAPAIRHPLDGTPQVVTRVPANRNTNLYASTNGISFTARTFTTNLVSTANTKLYLNNVDVSASLAPLPVDGSTVSFSTAPATLEANKVYAARIELVDTTGTLRSTNRFWFDTFSDAFLRTAPVKTIEAEDYNYSGGGYQLDPIPVSGLDTNGLQVNGTGVGYYNLVGLPDIDFFKPGGHYRPAWAEYRTSDRVQITQGSYSTIADDEAADIIDAVIVPGSRIHDTQRSQYVATNVWEYQVRLTSPGDWMNYTRSFTKSNYLVYLRAGTFGATTVFLDKVTGDTTTSNQTTVPLGTFNVDNHIMRLNYRYVPLMAGSAPAVVTLSGTNTLRLTMGGVNVKHERLIVMDYLLFVPTDMGPTIFDNFNDGNDSANPPWNRYDPIGGVTAPPASFILTGGVYHIIAPAPPVLAAGPARAGSFLRDAVYTDFYVAVDVLDFDDTKRQAFGIGARINTPGLGTTDGYLFSWEPGSGTLPGTNNGDLDISVLVSEQPVGQIETGPSGFHLERGRSYRFVFMGKGFDFEGQVYEYPNLSEPQKRLPATDTGMLYASGQVGLVVASQGNNTTVSGDAVFDNFLATTGEPRLTSAISGGVLTLTWPQIPFLLQSTPSLNGTPVWTDVTTGISQVGDQNVYSTPAVGTAYYRLIWPPNH